MASWGEAWVALVSFSACALKCAARDGWFGWDLRQRYRRLKRVVNNSRFLILPEWHAPNLGWRVLALCQRRVGRDGEASFGHGVVLLEALVDPERFRGTVYRAANWVYVGNTRGFRRTHLGYSAPPQSPKMVLLKPLRGDARGLLSSATLPPPYRLGESKTMLTAAPRQSLPCSLPNSRSSSRSGQAPSLTHGAGHRRRSGALWHARLQGHRRLGARRGEKARRRFSRRWRKSG